MNMGVVIPAHKESGSVVDWNSWGWYFRTKTSVVRFWALCDVETLGQILFVKTWEYGLYQYIFNLFLWSYSWLFWRSIGADDIFQNLLNIEGFVTLLDPSKSSMNATPLPSPVLEFEIELGLGNTCATSPSIEKLEIFSAFKKLNWLILADKLSKSVSYLPLMSHIKFWIGSYPTSTFLFTISWS